MKSEYSKTCSRIGWFGMQRGHGGGTWGKVVQGSAAAALGGGRRNRGGMSPLGPFSLLPPHRWGFDTLLPKGDRAASWVILGPHSTKVAVCQKTRAENWVCVNWENGIIALIFTLLWSSAVYCYVVQYVCITMYVEYVSSQVTWGSFKYLLLRNFQSLF